jgi:hypothetical protein
MDNELMSQGIEGELEQETDQEEPTGTEPAAEPEGTEPPEEPEGTQEGGDPSASVDDEPMTTEQMAEQMRRLNNQVNSLQRRLSKQHAVARPAIAAPPPLDESTAPKVEDFDTIESYNHAHRTWEIDQRVSEGIRKATAGTSDTDVKAARADFAREAMENGKLAYQDFDKIVGSQTLPITVEMIDAIRTESDSEVVNPEDILYYLGKNPDETAAISRMSKSQVARQIAKIEARLEAVKGMGKTIPATPAGRPKKTVSDAPTPIKPTDSAVIIHKDPAKMSQKEYEAWRMTGGT